MKLIKKFNQEYDKLLMALDFDVKPIKYMRSRDDKIVQIVNTATDKTLLQVKERDGQLIIDDRHFVRGIYYDLAKILIDRKFTQRKVRLMTSLEDSYLCFIDNYYAILPIGTIYHLAQNGFNVDYKFNETRANNLIKEYPDLTLTKQIVDEEEED